MSNVMTISADGQSYPLDYDHLTNKDVMALEAAAGQTMEAWSKTIGSSPSMRDLTLMVWLARRQNGEPDLALDDVVFRVGSLDIEAPDEDAQGTDERPTVTPDASGTVTSPASDSAPAAADTSPTSPTTSASDPGNGASSPTETPST